MLLSFLLEHDFLLVFVIGTLFWSLIKQSKLMKICFDVARRSFKRDVTNKAVTPRGALMENKRHIKSCLSMHCVTWHVSLNNRHSPILLYEYMINIFLVKIACDVIELYDKQ